MEYVIISHLIFAGCVGVASRSFLWGMAALAFGSFILNCAHYFL